MRHAIAEAFRKVDLLQDPEGRRMCVEFCEEELGETIFRAQAGSANVRSPPIFSGPGSTIACGPRPRAQPACARSGTTTEYHVIRSLRITPADAPIPLRLLGPFPPQTSVNRAENSMPDKQSSSSHIRTKMSGT
jgi:hypothetical protein